jgi:squalene synthase HpnC
MKYPIQNIEDVLELTHFDGGKFKVNSLMEAEQFCKSLAVGHYENFPVGSLLISKKFRNHIFNLYAFARVADDIADELTGIAKELRIEALNNYEKLLLDNSYLEAKEGNPIFLALHQSMKGKNLPALPFQKLLIAFKRDINFEQAQNFEDLEDYCSYSANPVGEIVLRIFGLYNDITEKLSNNICTGLQLVNFCQDLSRDLKNKRYYIPSEILVQYKLDNENLQDEKNSVILTECLRDIYDYTEKFLILGKSLIKHLDNFRFRMEMKATIEGGMIIQDKLRRLGTDVIRIRPKLTLVDLIKIFFRTFYYK